MSTTKAPRTKTERVDAAVEDVIEGGTRDRELNPAERRLYEELVARIRNGELDADGDLWRLDYSKPPPNIETFILDDYFLGLSLRPVPGENEGIWPAWMSIFTRDFDLDSYIHNLVITGSLGIGKTWMMVTVLLYRICIATHLKNPQNFFGISRGSRIIYNFLSVTKEAVRDTAFGDAMNFMGESAYFREVCGFDPDMDYAGFRIPMLNSLPDGRPSNIWLTAGSKGQHLLGRNVVGVGLDEGNFRLEKDPDLTAYVLYDAVRTRISNRFQKLSTFLPALSVIASSAADESSFTEKVVGEIEQQNAIRDAENAKLPIEEHIPKTQTVYRNAVYRIKRHALQDIGPDHLWFKVAYGLKNMEPYILSGWYREDGTGVGSDSHEEPPSGAKTELVPKFYYESFRRNCRTNLQALSGISVSGAHRLFASMVDVEWCIAQSEAEGVPNCVMPGVERIALSSEDNKNIFDYLIHRHFVTRVASRHMPKRHPDRLRYAHIDLATQNLCGVSICHLVGTQLVEGLVKDGEPFSEYRLIVEYDFILTICAGQSKPISIEKVQNFIFWLRDMCGFRFGKVTADMFQSESMLQALDAKGVETDKLSIDRDKSVYHSWRSGFEERRIRLARNAQMIRESEALLEMDRKYDHPPDGCFTGDTRVALLDGTIPTFVELAERYPNGEKFAVFSVDKSGICVGWAHSPRITRRQAELVEVTLDNFQVIRCTPDHLFMTLSGEWVKAKNLTPDTSIMPLYRRRERKGGWVGYERVWCPIRRKRVMVHQIVAEQLFGPLKGRIVHHRDEVRHNNDPANLELMTKAAHARHHTAERHKNDEDYVNRLRSGHAKYRQSGGNEKSRQNMLHLYETGVLKRGKNPCAIEGCLEHANARGLCGAHYQKWRRVKQAAERTSAQTNHTILSVRQLTITEDVWDITVDKTHNFALACGVFVHNSKDTTDGAAGAYYNAITSEETKMLMSVNAPVMVTNRREETEESIQQRRVETPMDIPLPPKGYTRIKRFTA